MDDSGPGVRGVGEYLDIIVVYSTIGILMNSESLKFMDQFFRPFYRELPLLRNKRGACRFRHAIWGGGVSNIDHQANICTRRSAI